MWLPTCLLNLALLLLQLTLWRTLVGDVVFILAACANTLCYPLLHMHFRAGYVSRFAGAAAAGRKVREVVLGYVALAAGVLFALVR